MKIGIKEIVTMGIGIILVVVLTNAQIPLPFMPEIAIHPRMAILALLSAIYGPLVGVVVGFAGHVIGDLLFRPEIYWSWVIPEAFLGAAIGFFAPRFAAMEGGFSNKKCILFFNEVQAAANAVAWLIMAPLLDIVMFSKTAGLAFLQGLLAFLINVIVVGVLGTLLLVAYSKISGDPSDLQSES